MRFFTSTLPMHHHAKRPAGRPDTRLTILVSFAAGILLGVPLTFGALFLGTLSAPAVISPGHPAETRFSGREDAQRSGPDATAAYEGIGESTARPRPATLQQRYVAATVQIRNKVAATLKSRDDSTAMPRGRKDFTATLKSRDNSTTTTKYRGDFTATLQRPPTDNTIREEEGPPSGIFDGVFWTDLAESYVPRGFGEASGRRWRESLNATAVVRLEPGCGRMQNRLATLSDGRTSCCRYRRNDDQIQGEIFSFYLGRLLGMDNLAPSALALVDPRTRQWSRTAPQMALAGWSPGRPAVLTQFVKDLQPAYVPLYLRDSKTRRLHPVAEELRNLTAAEVSELVQWSDLVIFDYLTANLDRVVNNMFNERWNPGMMSQPTHNLAKTREGLLLFLDNESGLLHGYRLLQKYEPLHGALLRALCLFRKGTVGRVRGLLEGGDVEALLREEFLRRDPGMSEWLPFLPDRSIRTLKERMRRVMEQVRKCQARFEPATHS